jgi:hypothetical protein
MCAANFFNGMCAITNFLYGTHVKDSKVFGENITSDVPCDVERDFRILKKLNT